ncbi:MAG TPA: hypothetical protein VND91_04045 [Candidatus Saccharimonadia bacterium]|nr:hypothetical protein [Candidatus Saccharimonadia bacterium]
MSVPPENGPPSAPVPGAPGDDPDAIVPVPPTAPPAAPPGQGVDDAVPAADVPEPTPLEELFAFGGAVAKSANAELTLSFASFVRAAVFGLAALGAVALAWLTAMVALTVFLVQWLGVVYAFALLAIAHGAAAMFAWKRRMLWQKRIGFPRTRAAIATVAGLREPPP